MSRFVVIDAPSVLGLKPSGVELLPEALRRAGLNAGLAAAYAGRLAPPPFDPQRDPATRLLNSRGLHDYARQLADAISAVRRDGGLPVVLGGDCSNLIGCALALRRAGRYGLFFVDGHADFYQPEVEPHGEVASMELGIVSGRGPSILTDIEGLRPLLRDEDIAAFGYRDAAQQREYGSQDIGATAIHTWTLEQVRALGIAAAAQQAVTTLLREPVDGIWLHLDVDVLDDAIMPAVDYRMPGGMSWDELRTLLQVVMGSGAVVGLNIGIFNPRLDPDGSIARDLATCIVKGIMVEA